VENDLGGLETSRHQGFQRRGGVEEVQFVVEVAVKGSPGRSRPQRVSFPHTGRRRAVFSKGCAPRVRVVRPHECRDIFIFTTCVDDDPVAKRRQRWG
jgi:hypothetical protein